MEILFLFNFFKNLIYLNNFYVSDIDWGFVTNDYPKI